MSEDAKKPEELANVDFTPPRKNWMDPSVEFTKGTYNYGSNPKSIEYLGLPYSNDMWPIGYDGRPDTGVKARIYPELPLIEGNKKITNFSFVGAIFEGGTSFDNTELITSTDFTRATFKGETSFSNATLTADSVTFCETKFLVHVDFRESHLHHGVGHMCFDRCKLDGVLLAGWKNFDTLTEFRDCVWPRKKYFGLFHGRMTVADEALEEDHK